MSTETTNKKIKIDNGTTFGRTYTDKAIDAKLPTDLIATAKKLSLGAGNTALGNGVNLDGFTYDEATKTLKVSGGEGGSSKITITSTESDWTGSGENPHARWSSNSGYALKPNTAYEIGDNVKVVFTKSFNTQYLQENQIIVPCSSMTSLSYANYTLKYGDVVLVLTNTGINLQCSSKNNKEYHVSAITYLTYSVVKAGTTGADISLPSSGWDCTYSYIIYTLGTSVA